MDESRTSPAGWYQDPSGRAPLRYWTGHDWSKWTSDGTTVRADERGTRRHLALSDFAHLDFIDQVFLPEARAKGYLTASQEVLLNGLLKDLMAEASERIPENLAVLSTMQVAATAGAPAEAVAPHLPLPAPAGPAQPPPAPAGPTSPVLAAPAPSERAEPRPPSALALWWQRTREAVGSDLAVHGLAYIGVLLFFVGAFGLVVFAFGDVAPALRPVAEAVIALAPFGAGMLLRRRGATVVGRALEVAGGLVLPIMLITTFLDGVAFPPDLEGVPLVVTLTVLVGLVAAAYAVWARRTPESALRYLVAPVAWLTVGMATLGLARDIPSGKAVATPSAAQAAAMTAALVLSVAGARLRPASHLSPATRVAALPGLAVLGGLTLLSWIAEGWPGVLVLLGGVLVLLALELVADRMPALAGILEPLWWVLVSVGLAQGAAELELDGAVVAGVAAAGFVAIVETAGAARRPGLALALPAGGAVLALAATWMDPWWATASFGAAAVWVAARRRAPFGVRGAAQLLDLATALLPVLALTAFMTAADLPSALLAGSSLVLLTSALARWGWLDRGSGDRYWARWWAGGALLMALVALSAWTAEPLWDVRGQWFVSGAFGLLTVATTFGPIPVRWRAPVVTGLASMTWVVAADVLGASAIVLVTPLAAVGLGLVIAAHMPISRSAGLRPGSLGLTGHTLGLAALLMAPPADWALVIATGFATAGWFITGWLEAQGRSTVGAALGRVHAVARWVPLAVTAAGLPITLSLGLDQAGLLGLEDPWSVAVPAVMAVAYAGLTRLSLPSRVVAVAAWGGFLWAVAASGLSGARMPGAMSLAAVPVAVALVRPDRRARVMTWTGWIALTPLAALLATEYSSWYSGLPTDTAGSVALLAVGSVLLVGGAAADLRGRSWTPRMTPSHEWALAPAVIGAVEVVAALAVATTFSRDVSGWVFATAALAAMATAAVSRAGALAGASVLLGWSAALLLAGAGIEARPWVAVVSSVAVLLSAQAVSMRWTAGAWWSRWDLPLAVAAAPVAITALAVASGDPTVALTFTAVGAEGIAVAGRLRRLPVAGSLIGATGTGLVLVGAGVAGTGWLALALAALSAALSGLAVVARGVVRTALQLGGAAAAVVAWRVGSDWLRLSDQRAVDVVAVAAAVIAMAAAAAALRSRPDRSWVLVWGGSAVIVEAVCAWDALSSLGILRAGVVPSWAVTAGLIVVAVALAAGSTGLRMDWLRDAATASGIASLMVGLPTAHVPVTGQVATLSVLSAVTAALILAISRTAGVRPWRRPLIVLGMASTLLALAIALLASDDRMLLVPALAASAVQAAAAGVAVRQVSLQMASPVLACGAWLVFSLEALNGNPQWVTVPIGLTTLVVVALWRRDRQEHGGPVASTEIVTIELIGVAFLVGTALVQVFTDSLAYALLAGAMGLGVIAWGVVTKVRRRVAAGAAIAAVSVALLIGVPLVNLLPRWEGATLWVLIGGVGLAAVLIASLIERGRAALRKGMRRLAEATAGWE